MKSLNIRTMDKLYSEIGARMRELRKTLKLTQAQVAEAVGIDASFYGQVERGANIPSIKTLVSIARVLHTEPTELFPTERPKSASGYAKIIEELVADLDPKQKRLVLGLVSDMVERLKR